MSARSWTAGHPFDAGMTVPVFDRCLETVSQAHPPAVPPPSSADAREGAGCWIGPLGGVVMRAVVGDRVRVHGRAAGTSDQTSAIIEVRGPDGAPPYLVRHDDGQEALVFPGSDALVEHPHPRANLK